MFNTGKNSFNKGTIYATCCTGNYDAIPAFESVPRENALWIHKTMTKSPNSSATTTTPSIYKYFRK